MGFFRDSAAGMDFIIGRSYTNNCGSSTVVVLVPICNFHSLRLNPTWKSMPS